MFGLFSASPARKVHSLHKRAQQHYGNNFNIVFDASNQAIKLLEENGGHDSVFGKKLLPIAPELYFLRGFSRYPNPSFDNIDTKTIKFVIGDIEKCLHIMSECMKDDIWLMACLRLSEAYAGNPMKDNENIEQAIKIAEQAKAYCREKFLDNEYASICINLANYYSDRCMGEKNKNTDDALSNISEAVRTFTEKEHYSRWVNLKCFEGDILAQTNYPSSPERIEVVIQEINLIVDRLNVHISNTNKLPINKLSDSFLPEKIEVNDQLPLGDVFYNWIKAKDILSALYVRREKGNKGENIEQAIKIMGKPISEEERSVPPNVIYKQYMMLSDFYGKRIEGERKDNLEFSLDLLLKAEKYFYNAGDHANLLTAKLAIAGLIVKQYEVGQTNEKYDIKKMLVEAISISENSGTLNDLLNQLINLATYYSIETGSGNDVFDKLMAVYERIELLSHDFHPAIYHKCLVQKANDIAKYGKESFVINTAVALELLYQSKDYFEEIGIEEFLVKCKLSIAKILIYRHENGIPDSDHRATALLESLLDNTSISNDPEKAAEIGMLLSKTYGNRTSGNKAFNQKTSIGLLHAVLDSFNSNKHTDQWVDSFLPLVKKELSNCNKELALFLKKFVREEVMLKIDSHSFPEAMSRLLVVYTDILRECQKHDLVSWESVISTSNEAVEILEEHKKKYFLCWVSACTHLAWNHSWLYRNGIENADLSIQMYSQVLKEISSESHPRHYISIKLELGELYADLHEWNLADIAFEEAIKCADRNFGDDERVTELLDSSSGWSLVKIPFVALMNGDLRRALTYSEKFKSRKLRTELATEEYISSQVNEDSLRDKYRELRMGERILETQDDGETQETISKLEQLKSELDQSSQGEFWAARNKKFDLDDCLSNLKNWVFIPFLGYDKSKLVLIPPKATLEDIHVSDVLDQGYETLLRYMAGDVGNKYGKESGGAYGWLMALEKFLCCKDNPNKTDEEISNLLGIYENKHQKLNSALWETYGKWIVGIIESAVGVCQSNHLTIIPQSPLQSFPMASIARDDDSKCFLEYLTLSYSPSLYAKNSIDQRASRYSDKPALTFLDTDHNDLQCGLLEGILASSHFEQADIVDIHDQEDIEAVRNRLKKSNYWHFAMHGEFRWSNSYDSYLKLAGKKGDKGQHELRLNLLSMLYMDNPLRLVVLSACEAGMQNVVDTPNEPQGFPESFIQIGAIGVIAPLWSVTDTVSSLIMSKFYDFHMSSGVSPAKALAQAQCWLKNSSKDKIVSYLEGMIEKEIITTADAMPFLSELEPFDLAEYPYELPYFWASFVYYGA